MYKWLPYMPIGTPAQLKHKASWNFQSEKESQDRSDRTTENYGRSGKSESQHDRIQFNNPNYP